MRSLWSGSITLSFLNMPVKLGSTTAKDELGLHLVDKRDGARIKFARTNAATGEEVEWGDIAKGYDSPDGGLVVLDKQDFEQAYGEKNRVAEILMFTEPSNIPPLAVKSASWVQPAVGGEKAYALLAQAIQETGKVAVLSFAMRDRQRVGVLRAHDGYLSLEQLEWASDMIKPDFAAPVNTASTEETSLAHKLIDSLTMKYDHAGSVDKSTEAVQQVIQGKIERGEVMARPASDSVVQGAPPQDLMASLQAAVEAQKKDPAPKAKVRTARKAS